MLICKIFLYLFTLIVYNKYVNTVNRTELSLLGMVATEAADKYGSDWLDGLLKTLKRNYEYIRDELKSKVPDIITSPLEGTYLAFMDLRKVVNPDRVKEFIQDDCKIAIENCGFFLFCVRCI